MTEENIRRFAAAWYLALDTHAPAEECHQFLSAQGLEFAVPEGAAHSYAEFDRWLIGFIYQTFFDENHNLHSVAIRSRTENTAEIDVVVGWQASWFTPPEAKSRRTAMNAVQRWTLRRTDRNIYGLEIVTYYVDRFDFAPGFAHDLPQPPAETSIEKEES